MPAAPERVRSPRSQVGLAATLFLVCALTSSCAGPAHVNEPMQSPIDGGAFKAQLELPCRATGCMSVYLTLHSYTDTDIVLEWANAAYVRDGKDAGGVLLLVDGVLYAPTKENEALGLVAAGYNYAIEVVPAENIRDARSADAAPGTIRVDERDVAVFGLGKHGIRVPIQHDGSTTELSLSTCLRRSDGPPCEGGS